MASTSVDRISASGRVVRVAPSYVYIYSDQYGSVFSYPQAYFDYLPEKPQNKNLTAYLRVDEVVHFVAVPQNGPNDCHWIAVKITKRQTAENGQFSIQMGDQSNWEMPEVISNVTGTIVELYDRNGFIFSETYGMIYFPMAAAAPVVDSNEIHPLDELFAQGDEVLLDAQRQPCTNDCLYAATRVQLLPSITGDINTDQSSFVASAVQNGKNMGYEQSAIAVDFDPAMEEGEISRLFPQYGFIRSDKLGSVYFTLAHFESVTGLTLMDELTVGDRVSFLPMSQPEKNSCRWRGIKVKKMEPDLITPLAEMMGEMIVDQVITCEVSVQTDQSLWNAFLAQASSVGRRRPKQETSNDAACQTRMPPEALLLKAVKEDDELKMVLRERFPHLMLFIDKTT